MTVDGRRRWVADPDRIARAEPAHGSGSCRRTTRGWSGPTGDVLVPEAARRMQIRRAANNPGVLLIDGEIEGVWRARGGRSPAVAVKPFGTLPAVRQREIRAEAERIRPAGGDATVLFE